MDIVTHVLLGVAVSPTKELAGPMAIAGMVPDMWTVPSLLEYLYKKKGRYRNREFWTSISPRYKKLAKWSHSVVLLVIGAAVGVGMLGWSPWLFLSWFLHLLVDIPTHSTSQTGRLFYPFTDEQLVGWRNWPEMRWLPPLSSLVLLAVIVYRWW